MTAAFSPKEHKYFLVPLFSQKFIVTNRTVNAAHDAHTE